MSGISKAKWRRLLLLVVVVIAVAIPVGIKLARYFTRSVTVDGTITWLDPEAREASFEFVVPWKGEFMELRTPVPDDCEIAIGEASAAMAELRPGDKAKITATFNKARKQIIPVKVVVNPETRPEPLPDWPPKGTVSSAPSAG